MDDDIAKIIRRRKRMSDIILIAYVVVLAIVLVLAITHDWDPNVVGMILFSSLLLVISVAGLITGRYHWVSIHGMVVMTFAFAGLLFLAITILFAVLQ